MKRRSTKLLFPLLAALFAIGGALNQSGMNRLRVDLGLTRTTPLENAPPVLAFTTVALGGFRGVIANVLWMRAVRLQDEGKYFEMVMLADWITKLQPFFGSVWSHQAWNMAYNISREFRDPYERWLWVKSAIELLRDEGIQYNPTEPLLYQELAWIYHDKMGSAWDDAHWYYKNAWAKEMDPLIGKRPDWDALLNPQTPEEKEIARTVRDVYHLDVATMKEADEKYGPLDWRLPDAHAIYWALYGLKQTGDKNPIILYRAIWQSLIQAFKSGRVIENYVDRTFDVGPNLDIAPKVNKVLLEMMERLPGQKAYIGRAYRGFLADAAYFCFTENRMNEAAHWFKLLKEKYPEMVKEDESLSEYAVRQVTERITQNRARARAVIEGVLINFYYYVAIGEDDLAQGHYRLAQEIYNKYAAQIAGQEERLGLGSFQQLKQQVLDQVLHTHPRFSEPLKMQLRARLGLPDPGAANEAGDGK